MNTLILLAIFALGLSLGRYGEPRTQSRFRPVPTSIKAHIRYIDHAHDEPVASFRHAEGSL